MMRRALLSLALLCAGCSGKDDAAITVSVIGTSARAVNPNVQPLDAPSAVLTGALMQGLVQYDARGEVEPALAERWLVTDDGLSYIFRIRRAKWSDGTPVTAEQVAKSLRLSLSAVSRNPLKPLFAPVREVVAMTDSVLEIRLSEPQGNLLDLMARPEMAILRAGKGTGPFRLHRSYPNARVLRPVIPDTAEDVSEEILARSERRVRAEPAANAIARFAMGNAALVLGGSFTDYPLALVSGARALRRDNVPGIFGLQPVRADGPAGSRDIRRALAMAIDREAFVKRMRAQGWAATETLMPGPIDRYIEARPDWMPLQRQARLDKARALIAQTGTRPLKVSVSLPDGPGARLLFAQLESDWQQIGVEAVRARDPDSADFRLLDAVAPAPSALWYIWQFACGVAPVCSQETSAALSLARRATAEERARLFSEADQAISSDQLFIPIALPLRWSLVDPRLTGYAENATGLHPLNRLGSAGN